MQRSHCDCPINSLQRIAVCLNQDTLPFDNILQIGSELIRHLKIAINCESCITTKRTTNLLSHITSRIVGFYEAAYLNASSNSISTTKIRVVADADFLPTHPSSQQGHQMSGLTTLATQQSPGCQIVSREMKLGELFIRGSEARILVEMVLVDACSDLNEKIQEWKLVVDRLLEEAGEQYLVQDDALLCRCLDKLAKLIGLLQLDGAFQ